MKTRWEEPKILVQQFLPNEYVAACGVIDFKCDAGKANVRYAVVQDGTSVAQGNAQYLEDSNGKLMNGSDAWYTQCGKTYRTESDPYLIKGYHLDNPNTEADENIKVVIWTANGTDTHATKNLFTAEHESSKS